MNEEDDPGSDSEDGDISEDSNAEDYFANDYGEEAEESDDERWARDHRARNGFVYGDELDDDRDGFDTDEEPVHPLHKPIGALEDSDEDERDEEPRWGS